MLSDKLLEKSDFNVDRETAVSKYDTFAWFPMAYLYRPHGSNTIVPVFNQALGKVEVEVRRSAVANVFDHA